MHTWGSHGLMDVVLCLNNIFGAISKYLQTKIMKDPVLLTRSILHVSRVRVKPVQKSRVSEDLTPTISSLFPSSYLEIREDWKLANQRPAIHYFDQSESRKQTWLSSISPSRHSADHSLASESLIDIFLYNIFALEIFFVIYFSGIICWGQ